MVVPGWRGNMMVRIVCPEKRPVMATIRPGVMERGRPDLSRKGEIVAVGADIDDGDFRTRTVEMVRESEPSELEQAKIVVSGGFGFYEVGEISLLEELAQAIGGVTAGSRPACDAGWVPESRMIGQSGSTVSPDLFISIAPRCAHTRRGSRSRSSSWPSTETQRRRFSISPISALRAISGRSCPPWWRSWTGRNSAGLLRTKKTRISNEGKGNRHV
jgi:hypothetical protein